MRPIRAILADDEPLSLRRLEIALRAFPDIEIVGSAAHGFAALALIQEKRPDLVFLDLRMPGLSGIELAESLDPRILPAIVFVTAFDNFAVDAFGVNAVDYLLKPLDTGRLAKAIDRVRDAIEGRNAMWSPAGVSELVATLQSDPEASEPSHGQFLWVPLRDRIVRIGTQDVVWIEAAGDYVIAHTAGQDYLMPDSLRALEDRLDPQLFIRVHRSRIVNRKFIVGVMRLKFGKACLRLATGEMVPVGRSYRTRVLQITRP